jgi:hypothetical protein
MNDIDEKLADIALRCVDCAAGFVWTIGEQAFFTDKGLTPPKRCPACRSARRAERTAAGSSAMLKGR